MRRRGAMLDLALAAALGQKRLFLARPNEAPRRDADSEAQQEATDSLHSPRLDSRRRGAAKTLPRTPRKKGRFN